MGSEMCIRDRYVAHSGIGTDFLQTVEEIKITADSYAEDEEGISLGVLSIANHVALGEEVRSYPGGTNAAAITYTIDDLNKGRAHPTIHVAGGIQYYSNRWMGSHTKTGACYLLNPNGCEWWVNAGNDFRTTKFTDHLETSNQDADVGYIILEVQLAVPNLLVNGCTNAP